jgi:hypothetical protein
MTESESQSTRPKMYIGPSELATLSQKVKSSSDHNPAPFCKAVQSLEVSSSNKAFNRGRTKSGHGRSSDATGTGKQSAREPPPCLNTKKCSGEKNYLFVCPHTGKDKAIVLLSKYKRNKDADMKKANFKTLGNNRTTSENRDGQTAYLTAENLGVKVTVLADIGSN